MKTKHQPNGYQSVIPYILSRDVKQLMDFTVNAFNAEVIEKVESNDGKVMHGEIRIGDSVIMFGNASEPHQPTFTMLYIYCNNCDALYKQALKAGAESVMEPADQFYGDRNAGVKDSQGNLWWLATHVEDLSKEEMAERSKKAMAAKSSN